MGLLTYDIPELNTTGAQPATDIVDAFTDIQTEVNGSIETANLADGGLGRDVWTGDRTLFVSAPNRVTLTKSYQQVVQTVQIPECDLFSAFWSCDVGSATALGVQFRFYTALTDDALNPIFPPNQNVQSLPGDGVTTSGLGAPLVFPWAPFTLFVLTARADPAGPGVGSYVENAKLHIRTYGGF